MVPINIHTRPISADYYAALIAQGVPAILARLWAARGVQQIPATSLAALIPPQQLHNIEIAASILADAIEQQRHIMIVADYDCDGATACAIAIRGLKLFGASVSYYVPNRFTTGYGLSPAVIDGILETAGRPDLIVTVDNGIASIQGVEYARSKGIEVLITDHHLPAEQTPNALTIVNPNQKGCTFPSKNLAGCGVMYYVLIALRSELRQRQHFNTQEQPNLRSLLDLVALGTIADVVKLDDNNRLLVQEGLKNIRHGHTCEGIKALFKMAATDIAQAKSMDLGFRLGPRLNAAGRLADMSIGIQLLCSDDPEECAELAHTLNQYNIERRQIERQIHTQADEYLTPEQLKLAGIAVYDKSWHIGVVGIVASRLKEKYWKPTIVFAPGEDGTLHGSGRSIQDVHLRDVLDLVSKRLPQAIIKFGGHAMAAGLTLRPEYLADFQHAFHDAIIELTGRVSFEPTIEIDTPLSPQEYTPETALLLEQQVWGAGFAPPLFCDTFAVVAQHILKDKHLKLTLQKDSQTISAIWFNHNTLLPPTATLVFELHSNYWNGTYRLQLLIQHEVPNL